MSNAQYARCAGCAVLWWWSRGRRTLRDARCPRCGGILRHVKPAQARAMEAAGRHPQHYDSYAAERRP